MKKQLENILKRLDTVFEESTLGDIPQIKKDIEGLFLDLLNNKLDEKVIFGDISQNLGDFIDEQEKRIRVFNDGKLYKIKDGQNWGYKNDGEPMTKYEVLENLSNFHDIDFNGTDEQENDLTMEEYLEYYYKDDLQSQLDFLLDYGTWDLEEIEMPLSQEDLVLLWQDFGDVHINSDDEIAEDWKLWERGTPKNDIWHYFDENYKGGLKALMNL